VNKVTDFNCNKNEPTLIELTKVTEAKNRGRIFQIDIEGQNEPLDVNFLDMEPNNDFSAPIGTGKYRFQIDSAGAVKITNDSGVTKSSNGVKYEFDGTISQTGSSSPTIDSVGINTFTVTNAGSRTGVGTYRLTGVGSFAGTVTIQITNGDYAANDFYIEAKKISNDVLEIRTYDASGLADGILKEASLNIKVY
jgi:hypothetical protein